MSVARTLSDHGGSRLCMASRIALLLIALSFRVWAQSEPYLVKDINPTGGSHSNPRSYFDLGGTPFFIATRPDTGYELWTSDGTAAGTVLVKDIWPGPDSSGPSQFASANGTLFFTAHDGVHGQELWKSDGTTAGTVMVKDIVPGPGSSSPAEIVAAGDGVYFRAFEEGSGVELWKSDGSDAGTVRVKDIVPGVDSSGPYAFTLLDETLYFVAYEPETGGELWRSDGSETGTTIVKDIEPGVGPSSPGYLTVSGDRLFFFAATTESGYELWRSDGTAAGTAMVVDQEPGPGSTNPVSYLGLIDVGGALLYWTYSSSYEAQLWKNDGSAPSTQIAPTWPLGSGPSWSTKSGGAYYFVVGSHPNPRELWISDGTASGTVPVDTTGLWPYARRPALVDLNGTLVMLAHDGEQGNMLWRRDVTSGVWSVLTDRYPQPFGAMGSDFLIVIGDTIHFNADNGTHGVEPWSSKGTTFTTRMLKDINPSGGSDSSPRYMGAFGDLLLFRADEPGDPERLWVTDGTSAKTVMLEGNHVGGIRWPWPQIEAGGTFYLVGNNAEVGTELWKSDGTWEGTVLVKDIVPGPTGSYPKPGAELGGRLYFGAQHPSYGYELWSSDGTEAGTGLVKDIATGAYPSQPGNLTRVGDTLFFTTTTSGTTYSNYLWKSDGSEAGTVLVKEIWQGSGNGDPGGGPRDLVELNGGLYFLADDGIGGWQLWTSDGTEAGTQPVTDLGFGRLYELTRLGDRLLFIDPIDFGPGELWASDGTAAGTTLVRGGFTNYGFVFGSRVAIGDRLYFSAADDTFGYEPWYTDGTPAGTGVLKDIVPGSGSSTPIFFTNKDDLLLFVAHTPAHGGELWISDGTEANTQLVADIHPGPDSSNPREFALLHNTLFFSADDGEHGKELWAYQVLPDADGDGLPDEWELNGYTHVNGQFVDLPALGADWQHKDLFVEIDHMKSAEYDHRPDPEGLAEIVAAFDRAPVSNPDGLDGIKLHLNVWAESESVLAFEDPFGSGPDPNHYDWTRFDEIKAANFAKELEWSHHYCIFAHTLPTGDGTDSGLSRGYVANDFIVALGSRTNGVGTKDQQAGTFMHELGHNLGLGHGGTDEVNNKPNYLSVMNWNFQMRGLIHTDPLRKWDYSREALPPLDENQLWEVVGLSGTAISVGYGTIYWSQLLSRWLETAAGSAGLPIDWDGSGTIETENPIAVDLDKDLRPLTSGGIVIPGFEAKAPLRGASDWDRILFGAGRIGGGRPSPRPEVTPAEEMDLETEDELRPDPPGKVHGHVATGKIVLTWKPAGPRNTGIIYRVYRRGGGTQGVLGATELSTFHDSNVTSGTTYVYSVTWVDASGAESAPAEVTLTAK